MRPGLRRRAFLPVEQKYNRMSAAAVWNHASSHLLLRESRSRPIRLASTS